MNIKIITYALITALVLPAAFFSEEEQDQSIQINKETAAGSLVLTEKAEADEQEENIKQHCEELLVQIYKRDADTGVMPEAGFSVNIKNEDLEKLLALGGKADKYIYSLLKKAKSGYIKERIIREISAGSSEPDELAVETLFAAIKDKSSQVRMLTAKILGECGNSSTITRLTSLLYDPYTLRKDVYPVRIAAKEAIELIKIRNMAALLPFEERVKKWVQVIEEKAADRQDYFCEKAVKELQLLSSAPEAADAKEYVWKELNAAKDVQGKKTLVNNKIYGYLLLASAMMKDERTIPLIENAFKDVSLANIAARSINSLSFGYALEMLLNEPAGSEKAAEWFNILKNNLSRKTILEIAAKYPKTAEGDLNKNSSFVMRKLLINRSNEIYKDAAKIFCYGLNDYPLSLKYLSIYQKTKDPDNPAVDETYSRLLSGSLAGAGKLKRAKEISPAMNLQPFLFNLQLLDMLAEKETALKKRTFRTGYYTAGALMNIKAYYKAAKVLKELLLLKDDVELTPAVIQEKINFCEEKKKEQMGNTLRIEKVASGSLKLGISSDSLEYKTGEEIKIKMFLKNTGKGTVNGVNDKEGNLGFDLIIMKNGAVLKRLKKDLSKVSEIEALEAGLFTLEPSNALASEITALTEIENDSEADLTLAVSYAPSPALNGYEKGWIEYPIISNELKIKIKKQP